MKKFIVDFIFIAFLVAGLVFNIKGAANVTLAFAWVLICLSPFLLTEAAIKGWKKEDLISNWIDLSIDIVIFVIFAWYGWLWTAAFFGVRVLIKQVAKEMIKAKGD